MLCEKKIGQVRARQDKSWRNLHNKEGRSAPLEVSFLRRKNRGSV